MSRPKNPPSHPPSPSSPSPPSLPGVALVAVEADSPAGRKGLAPGQRLVAINDHPIRDLIDLRFHEASGRLRLRLWSDGGERQVTVQKRLDEPLGVELASFPVRQCRNNCVFCFIRQQKPGLRPSLCVRDDDYRLSFLHGSYITGTNLTGDDLDRIATQRLAPLYLSIHATDPDQRGRLLGRRGPAPVGPLLDFLQENRLCFHTQIVLCPGWNDGEALTRSLTDLADYHPFCQSIAVVPVGLTACREGLPALRPMSGDEAARLIDATATLRRRLARRLGEDIIYLSDEVYLLARREPPRYGRREYWHQLENGVGMVHAFYHRFSPSRLPDRVTPPRRVALITGPLGAQALERFVAALNRVQGLEVAPLVVENTLYGPSVTVSGLLAGGDIAGAIALRRGAFDRFIVPENALRAEGEVFLDDLSLDDLRQATGADVVVGPDHAGALARLLLR